MTALRDLPLRTELAIIIAISSGIAVLSVCGLLVGYAAISYRAMMLRGLQTTTQMIALNSAAALLFEDRESGKEALQALNAEPRVVFACIFNKDGKEFANYFGKNVNSPIAIPANTSTEDGFDFVRGHLIIHTKIKQENEVVGTVFIQASMAEMHSLLRRTILVSAAIGAVTLAVALLVALILQRGISEPLSQLAQVTRSISTRKDYSLRAEKAAGNEIGLLVDSFNDMVAEIQRRESDLTDANDRLEERVEERTTKLSIANRQLQANEQELRKRTYDLGKRIMEQHCFSSIANLIRQRDMPLPDLCQKVCDLIPAGWQYPDITCARITLEDDRFMTRNFQATSWKMAMSIVAGDQETGMIEVCYLKEMPKAYKGPFLKDEEQLLQSIANRLGETIEYQRAEKERDSMDVQLRNAQKLEAVGQLAAGIAHEINTPIQFVGDNAHFLKDSFSDIIGMLEIQEKLIKASKTAGVPDDTIQEFEKAAKNADIEYIREEIPNAIDQAIDGINRVATIVRAMKEFSHQGSQDFTACDVNRAVENTIIISRNEWKYVADMKTNLDLSLPVVQSIQGELNQVILNLIVNAAHAIADIVSDGSASSTANEKGTITIGTRCNGDFVEISITDTGTGIPKTAQDHIFDPFFTTKEVGKGTGQGLAISYNTIVEKHGGQLTFETEEGKGTTFYIRLPLNQEKA